MTDQTNSTSLFDAMAIIRPDHFKNGYLAMIMDVTILMEKFGNARRDASEFAIDIVSDAWRSIERSNPQLTFGRQPPVYADLVQGILRIWADAVDLAIWRATLGDPAQWKIWSDARTLQATLAGRALVIAFQNQSVRRLGDLRNEAALLRDVMLFFSRRDKDIYAVVDFLSGHEHNFTNRPADFFASSGDLNYTLKPRRNLELCDKENGWSPGTAEGVVDRMEEQLWYRELKVAVARWRAGAYPDLMTAVCAEIKDKRWSKAFRLQQSGARHD